MSNRTLVAALAVAVALGLMVLWVVRGQPGGRAALAPGERLLAMSAADITGLTLAAPGAPVLRLSRAGDGTGWTLTGLGATSAPRAWPLEPERVHDVLRLLTEVRAVGTPAPDAKADPSDLRVLIEAVPGATPGGLDAGMTELRLSTRPLSGNVLATVAVERPDGSQGEARSALVADSLLHLLTTPGPAGWRERAVLPWVPEAARLRLQGGGTSVALARVGGQWSLSEPVAAPADQAAALRTLGTLQLVRIADFCDQQPAAGATGLDNPVARVVIEREAGGKVERRELIVGKAADAAASTLYASLDGGESVCIVAADKLAQVATDPARYVSRVASALQPADIGGLLFHAAPPDGGASKADSAASLGVRRVVDGWVEVRPDGSQVAQDPARVAVITGMVAFLTGVPATTVSLEPPAGFTPVGSLTVLDLAGAPREEVVVGRGAGTGVLLRSGGVYRGHASMPQFLLLALGPIAPAAAQAAAEGPEINK